MGGRSPHGATAGSANTCATPRSRRRMITAWPRPESRTARACGPLADDRPIPLTPAVDQSSPNRFASASASNLDSAQATTFRHPGRISWPTAHDLARARARGTRRRNGGFVAQYIVDDVLAYFGYPKRMSMMLSAQFAPGSILSRRFRSSSRMPVRPCRCGSGSRRAASWLAISSVRVRRRSRVWSTRPQILLPASKR